MTPLQVKRCILDRLKNNFMLESLKEYVRANNRVCLMPGKWNELWDMLPDKKRKYSCGWESS